MRFKVVFFARCNIQSKTVEDRIDIEVLSEMKEKKAFRNSRELVCEIKLKSNNKSKRN